MRGESQSFSKSLGSLVFHLMAGGVVYRVTCPREGRTGSRDGQAFCFEFGAEGTSKRIDIFASGTLLAEYHPEESLPLAMLRAAKVALDSGTTPLELHTGNFETFSADLFIEKPNSELRTSIVRYLLERYDILFEKPFSVVETAVAVQSTPERVLRELRFLHKHEMISFSFSSEVWPEGTPISQWLVHEFKIENNNYANLKETAEGLNRSTIYPGGAQNELEWDIFICHASEDKEAVVEPLAEELKRRGKKVWYDKWVLTVGDSLRQKIEEGLSQSAFGVVVLSPSFFRKKWPQRELDGLFQKELRDSVH